MLRMAALSLAILVLPCAAGAASRTPETFAHSDIPGVATELTSLDVYADGRPDGAPVVVFVHGGGWVGGSKSNVQQAARFLQFFEDRGMVLVSTGTRLVFDARSPDATFREQATDIASAVKWVKDNIRNHHGDPEQLFLLGYSAGAHLVALVGTDASYLEVKGLEPVDLRGVIALDVSAYDIPRAIVEAPSQGVPVSPASLTRVFSADREAQEAASPVYHVKPGRQYPPFLLVYGGIFDTNPEGVYVHTLTKMQSEAFADALHAAGGQAEVYGDPERTHRGIMRDFGSPGDGITHAVDTFLARHLMAPAAAAPPALADMAYVNGRIYTVDAEQSWAEAVAMRDGRFIAVGSNEDIKPFVGAETRVTDLEGRMAMPGIHDLHIHPVGGTLTTLYACNFPPGAPLDEIIGRIGSCAEAEPPGTWIRGGVFAAQLLEAQPPLDRSMLDAVAPEHPVILRSSGGHTAWVNTAALKLAGIDRDTPDPANGFIRRDAATGEPTGLLHESAGRLVERHLPDYSPEQYATAVASLARDLNRQGITSIKDASVAPRLIEAYAEAERNGTLTLRVAAALALRTDAGSMDEQLATVRDRHRYRTARINPDFVKIFVDGSAGARKAAFLEPYFDSPQHEPGYKGEFLVQPEQLKEYLVRLDREGVAVKMHCGGDAARRAALDAIEAARIANGNSGIPHEVSHPNLLHPDDLPRFAPLNAVADLTPVTWYPNEIIDLLGRALGEERQSRMWQIRSLVESGAIAVYGSDWPAVTPDTNPWRAMEAMITRRNPDTESGEAFNPEQAIDLATAIRIFTRNGAYAMRQAEDVGTIETGKAADMIVLEENLFEMLPQRLDQTRVLLTLLDGEEVYRDEKFVP